MVLPESGIEGQTTAWDSREKWTLELVYRIHCVLDSNQENIKRWFESLVDFFDLASCAISDRQTYEKRIDAIEQLIYAVKLEGRTLNERERKLRKEIAYKELRIIFRDIHTEIYKKGLIIPFKQSYSEVEGFESQFR